VLAIGAIAADFCASDGNFDLAVLLDLTLHLLEEAALHFPDLPAAQARDVNVVARAVALVKMLLAVDVEKIQLVYQSHFLEHIQCAVNGDAVDLRIDALRAFENRSGVEMALGVVHHLEKDAALAREADSALGKSGLKTPGCGVGVDAFTAGNALCVG
jgi:hypothetical protein